MAFHYKCICVSGSEPGGIVAAGPLHAADSRKSTTAHQLGGRSELEPPTANISLVIAGLYTLQPRPPGSISHFAAFFMACRMLSLEGGDEAILGIDLASDYARQI